MLGYLVGAFGVCTSVLTLWESQLTETQRDAIQMRFLRIWDRLFDLQKLSFMPWLNLVKWRYLTFLTVCLTLVYIYRLSLSGFSIIYFVLEMLFFGLFGVAVVRYAEASRNIWIYATRASVSTAVMTAIVVLLFKTLADSLSKDELLLYVSPSFFMGIWFGGFLLFPLILIGVGSSFLA